MAEPERRRSYPRHAILLNLHFLQSTVNSFAGDHENRLSFAVDLHILPSLILKSQARITFVAHARVQPDFLMYLRGHW